MISFISAIVLLIVGYFIYGKITERIFKIEPQRPTPVVAHPDGVDYVPLKPWKIYMIQFLNIAGLGPIFGAIMGAQFGAASFLWIVFGCIFGGAVHDFISGMISLRNNGASLPEIHGRYLGLTMKQIMRGLTIILMILVGAVFVSGPAVLLANLTPKVFGVTFWMVIIFIYYLIATLFPIDKIIGRFYPLFGFCLLFMAVAILAVMLYRQVDLPEIWEGLQNKSLHPENNPIFPMMFVSIACGAVSGFHATQSPLMARCMTNERQGRPIFFGAMITEGIIALIWAAAATYFFFENSFGKEVFATGEANGSVVVNWIARDWLGTFGAVLAILGVVAAPITSGDTAFRSARLIVADILHYDQKPIINRLIVVIPIFIAGVAVLIYSLRDANGFNILWRYFSWINQILAAITLWACTIYLCKAKRFYYITLVPALFMSMVSLTFILTAQGLGFGLEVHLSSFIAGLITLGLLVLFYMRKKTFSQTIG